MPVGLQGGLIIGLTVLISLVGLVIVHRRFPIKARQQNNEAAAIFIAVLGVVYAVLLAFLVVVVWQQFAAAATDVEHEGSALISVFRIGTALPEPTSSQIRNSARAYARVVIDEEWPHMAAGASSPAAARALDDLWADFGRFEPQTEREKTLYAEGLRRLDEIVAGRHTRILATHTGLPEIMWGLLIGGGIITIAFTYFVSGPSFRAQAAMTMLYSASLAFVVFIIALLDHPFQGGLRVGPQAFELALATFARLSGS
jgi:hypothetical protein